MLFFQLVAPGDVGAAHGGVRTFFSLYSHIHVRNHGNAYFYYTRYNIHVILCSLFCFRSCCAQIVFQFINPCT